VTGALAGLVFH